MHTKTNATTGPASECAKDEELIDTLTAISVVAKHLARKLQALSDRKQQNKEGGQSHGKNE